jgi:NitT/TauT family transport system substrate-binding protein
MRFLPATLRDIRQTAGAGSGAPPTRGQRPGTGRGTPLTSGQAARTSRQAARTGGRAARTSRRAAGTAAAAAGLLMAAGCQALGGSSAGGPAVSATLTVSATPGVPDAPLFIGLRDGLFKAAGLTIHLKSFSSVKFQASQVEHGRIDIGFGDYADLLYEDHASHKLAIVADGYDCGPNVVEILTLPDSPISTPQDLQGLRIGTPRPQSMTASNSRPYSMETTAAWAALSNNNVSPQSIHWIPKPAADLPSALKTHEVDAILATEPTISQAEGQYGVVPVLDACSGPTTNLPLDGYFTSQAFAKDPAHAAALRAFRGALEKAQAAASLSAPVQTALENYAQMDKDTAALVTVGSYPTELFPQNIQRVANLMFFYNSLQNPLGVGRMVAR